METSVEIKRYRHCYNIDMKTKASISRNKNSNVKKIGGLVLLLLLIPLILTIHDGGKEGIGWNWTFQDFFIMGILLFSSGLALDYAIKNIKTPFYRVSTIILILSTLLLIWVELAVRGLSQAVHLFF